MERFDYSNDMLEDALAADAVLYADHMIQRRNVELKEAKTGPTRRAEFLDDIDHYLTRVAVIRSVRARYHANRAGWFPYAPNDGNYITTRQYLELGKRIRRHREDTLTFSELQEAHPDWFKLHYTPNLDRLRQQWIEINRDRRTDYGGSD